MAMDTLQPGRDGSLKEPLRTQVRGPRGPRKSETFRLMVFDSEPRQLRHYELRDRGRSATAVSERARGGEVFRVIRSSASP